ncbi:IPT/TIG domain-containing protein [Actinotalea sp. AC32]|nr:IPT/TIG domain-containing protein [Actinotalea sp. AC32]
MRARTVAVALASAVAVSLSGGPVTAAGPSGTTTVLLPEGRWTGLLAEAVVGDRHVYAMEYESHRLLSTRLWAREITTSASGTGLGSAAVVAHASMIGGVVEDDGVLAYRRPVDERVVLRDASGRETLPDWGGEVLGRGRLLELDGPWLVTWDAVVHTPSGTVTPIDAVMAARGGRTVGTQDVHVEGDLLLWDGHVHENGTVTEELRAVRLGAVAPEGATTLLDSAGPYAYGGLNPALYAVLSPAGIGSDRVAWTRTAGSHPEATTQVRWVPTTDLRAAPRSVTSPSRGSIVQPEPFLRGSRVVVPTSHVDGTVLTELDLADPAAPATVEVYAGQDVLAGRDAFAVTSDRATRALTLRDRAGRPFRQVAGRPLLSSVAPSTGAVAGGGEVVVRGSGFTGATAVRFGGVPGTGLKVVSDGELRVSAPAAGWPGPVPVTVTTGAGTSGDALTSRYTYGSFVTQRPQRVLADPAATPGSPRCVQVAGRAGVPASASGVVVNVTTVRPTSYGHVVVYPDSDGSGATPPPSGSTVGFEPGRDVANAAFVDLPPSGRVCYLTRGAPSAGILLDVTGWSTDDAGIVTRAPERLLDTRPGADHVGELDRPLAPRERTTVQVTGNAGVPHGAAAVLVTVTVAQPGRVGNLRVASGDVQEMPGTSTVNYAVGQDKANAAVVPLSGDGRIALWSDSAAPVHVVVDVVGHVLDGRGWRATTPQRVLDTRPVPGEVEPSAGLQPRAPEQVSLRGVVPDHATAAVLNVTSIHPGAVGNLRVYPDELGTANRPPDASALNYVVGRDVPNLVVVAVPPSRQVVLWSDSGAPAHVAVDVVGYLTD